MIDESGRGFGTALRVGGKVLPGDARGHNRALVLQSLFRDGPLSRADLARRTGLTRVTISDLVSELAARTLVIECGVREAIGPGKPAMLVDLARDAHRVIALDLSEPRVMRGASMSIDGEILERRTRAAPPGDAAGAVAAAIDLVRELVSTTAVPVLGVGVGSPGLVSTDGVVISAVDYGWRDVALQRLLTDATGLGTLVLNDADAAVLAEHTYGPAPADVMLVRLGAGVGSGILAGGSLVRGPRFAAGEIGHVRAGDDDARRCVCARTGCLEAWASVPALRSAIASSGDDATVLREAGRRLSRVLAPIVGALDLSEIVLSGPSSLVGDILSNAVREALRHDVRRAGGDELSVRVSAHGDDLVVRGAAVAVLSARLGVS